MPGDKASSGDVLRALAEEALSAGVHPDRERVLRSYVGEDDGTDDSEPEPTPTPDSGKQPGRK
jgi:hypothetical protein